MGILRENDYQINPESLPLLETPLRFDFFHDHEQQKYISNPPKDLKLIQVVPVTELECGVISNNLKDIQMDYRYGLELGLDTLPELQTLSADLKD